MYVCMYVHSFFKYLCLFFCLFKGISMVRVVFCRLVVARRENNENSQKEWRSVSHESESRKMLVQRSTARRSPKQKNDKNDDRQKRNKEETQDTRRDEKEDRRSKAIFCGLIRDQQYSKDYPSPINQSCQAFEEASSA